MTYSPQYTSGISLSLSILSPISQIGRLVVRPPLLPLSPLIVCEPWVSVGFCFGLQLIENNNINNNTIKNTILGIELNWIELNWIELNWIELNWIE